MRPSTSYGDHFYWKGSFAVSFGNFPSENVIGFPRYIRKRGGGKIVGGQEYAKLKIHLREVGKIREIPRLYTYYRPYAYFGQRIFQFPVASGTRILHPDERYRSVLGKTRKTPLEKAAISLAQVVSSEVKHDLVFGVGGSMLLNCYGPASDVDLYIYDNDRNPAIARGISHLFSDGTIKPVSFSEEDAARKRAWKRLFRKLGQTESVLNDMLGKQRWILEGSYKGTPISIKLLLPREESYPDIKFTGDHIAELEGVIVQDTRILQKPSIFFIQTEQLGKVKIISFPTTHNLLRKGDRIRFRGKIQYNDRLKQAVILWAEQADLCMLPR